MSSSSSSSSSNANYNASLTTSTTAAAVANNNNNNLHSFVTSLTDGGEDNLNHNPHNNTPGHQTFVNGGGGGGEGPSTTSATSSLSANDLTNLSNLQVAAQAWNQQHSSQPQHNLTTLNVVGQAGSGSMSTSHV